MSKILIIEDEKALREEIADILRFEGFEVFQSDNGKDGIGIALEQKPDLILCDIMMPIMNGTDVLKNLMKSEDTRYIPFIFITALSERKDIREGMEMGADDYLIKPFSVNELLGSIKSRIDKYKTQQKLIQSNISQAHSDLTKRLAQLKDKIVEQNNDIDLLRLEKMIQRKNAPENGTIVETLKNIDSANKFHNLEKILDKELRNKQPNNTESFFVNLHNEIRKQSHLVNNWSMFQLKFNQLYPEFHDNLIRRFPGIKQSEIALASSISMNLSTLQIASLMNITAASVRKSRYRLKKKLGLQKEENLSVFFHSLNSKGSV